MLIDLNPQIQHALDLMENTTQNIFITGKAGTGKSTLLNHFRNTTPKNIVVLAPTGVAALNVSGQTIHSFFKFKPSITVDSVLRLRAKSAAVYRSLEAIVIDEISMVRADVMDCVDRFLRLNGKHPNKPFGGIQMIFIGDLYQLPPVITSSEREAFEAHYKSPYFFSAKFFESFAMEMVELEQVYRQKDDRFIGLLNGIRTQTFTQGDLDLLNSRVQEDFSPPEDDYFVYLTPYNASAQSLNEEHLRKLKGKPCQFEAEIEGDFKKDAFPTLPLLTICPQAQIMMVNNDPRGRWINGTMGKVITVKDTEDKPVIVVRLETGEKVNIAPIKWEISKFFLEEGAIKSEIIGSFSQYPVTLAWALTIHKSQGKTFEKVIFDISKGSFMPGQVYVALSRCTSLEGLILKKSLQRRHIWMDNEVTQFLDSIQNPQCPKITRVEEACQTSTPLRVVYRKDGSQEVTITIIPTRVGSMNYQGETYTGIEGTFQESPNDKRTFRMDRIIKFI